MVYDSAGVHGFLQYRHKKSIMYPFSTVVPSSDSDISQVQYSRFRTL